MFVEFSGYHYANQSTPAL